MLREYASGIDRPKRMIVGKVCLEIRSARQGQPDLFELGLHRAQRWRHVTPQTASRTAVEACYRGLETRLSALPEDEFSASSGGVRTMTQVAALKFRRQRRIGGERMLCIRRGRKWKKQQCTDP